MIKQKIIAIINMKNDNKYTCKLCSNIFSDERMRVYFEKLFFILKR